ncbi:DUF2491 family protein [Photobacterium kishitanii]|uniref:DUF2491 domain-containing protein n=1 Tax=Photobacterium kishitanii TaxID=318456 RepID=A0A2T3KM64_9GAMM|nr:DUF2491 family protein [Photobacterium kishitanii]PSV00897.1 hypothetical protein C9J27_02400 [Photobacterium kishitanii]
MSLINSLFNLFKKKQTSNNTTKPNYELASLGIKLNSKIEISHPATKYGSTEYLQEKWELPYKSISAQSKTKTCVDTETECIFYTYDEQGYLQIFYSGEDSKENRININLWMYCDFTEELTSQEVADKWIDMMNQNSFTIDNKTYTKNSPSIVESTQQIETIHGNRYSMSKNSMVFSREISDAESEMLTISIESIEQEDGSLLETGTIAVGISISPEQIAVF